MCMPIGPASVSTGSMAVWQVAQSTTGNPVKSVAITILPLG